MSKPLGEREFLKYALLYLLSRHKHSNENKYNREIGKYLNAVNNKRGNKFTANFENYQLLATRADYKKTTNKNASTLNNRIRNWFSIARPVGFWRSIVESHGQRNDYRLRRLATRYKNLI